MVSAPTRKRIGTSAYGTTRRAVSRSCDGEIRRMKRVLSLAMTLSTSAGSIRRERARNRPPPPVDALRLERHLRGLAALQERVEIRVRYSLDARCGRDAAALDGHARLVPLGEVR